MNDSLEIHRAELAAYRDRAIHEIQAVDTSEALSEWHRRHLSRGSGEMTGWAKRIGSVPGESRPAFGRLVNEAVQALRDAYESHLAHVTERERVAAAARSAVDVTHPPRRRRRGALHPVSAMLDEIIAVFARMGFAVYRSPHVETDDYNFTLLNMGPHHPARDMQDTFYVSPQILLRTHTSPGQVRAMRATAPAPLRVIVPGLCYRHEDVTPRSEMQFHQVEGLMVGPQVRLSDLKGVLLAYARHVFGPSQEVRMRASYFPFTEPSVEVDIKCTICRGEGCRVCKFSGWLELLGGGLVHPTVLENGGYDPQQVSGIAWGMGVERQLLLRHGITDIRHFFRNDLRFLYQFD